MSLTFIRTFHHKRIPNYDGYWTQILNRAINSSKNEEKTTREPISIPFTVIESAPAPITSAVKRKPAFVYLKGKPIELPEKPNAPDNCCMSGCAHCVWDIYQEDMDEYIQKKKGLRNKFIEAGETLPKELESTNNIDVMDEMDPTMKAFLEMERKLKNKNF
ncbi:oxidoreductase-like protein [Cokeromyces recurvatus]|uniref:oxidoreductase-like protein n=1 Tax=Cokeromyces recurvatus TaxID=90255 RepID=UPI00221F5E53|nr:oxidoreductase-like protein [Cokeromyces recurvatus]KAI7906458.1 oxidoreductase-like protein [Cokeromyces recurvatus]